MADKELGHIVAHYLEQLVRRAGLSGFDEMRAEIDAAVEADERRLTRRLDVLGAEINRVEEKVDQPDWRQRR